MHARNTEKRESGYNEYGATHLNLLFWRGRISLSSEEYFPDNGNAGEKGHVPHYAGYFGNFVSK
jgi:hypothetical protein